MLYESIFRDLSLYLCYVLSVLSKSFRSHAVEWKLIDNDEREKNNFMLKIMLDNDAFYQFMTSSWSFKCIFRFLAGLGSKSSLWTMGSPKSVSKVKISSFLSMTALSTTELRIYVCEKEYCFIMIPTTWSDQRLIALWSWTFALLALFPCSLEQLKINISSRFFVDFT